jgi:tetratricopeptide (TPR) repeat protein
VRVIDALYALGQFDEASAALRAALTADPGFSDCPDYGIIERALRAKGVLTQ